jgi:Ca2+-binding RTX toxin-like protein
MTSRLMKGYAATVSKTVSTADSFLYHLAPGETLTVDAGVILETTGAKSPVVQLDSNGIVVNNGTLKGSGGAIVSTGSGHLIQNAGTIANNMGQETPAISLSGNGGVNTINNTGTIRADVMEGDVGSSDKPFIGDAFRSAGNVKDIFVNKGIVAGFVLLGGGSDVFDSRGGRQNDGFVFGEAGNDRLLGGRGTDYLNGGAGQDRLSGGAGQDDLTGDTGHDHIDGGSGSDQLSGGAGRDRLSGGSGHDRLTGGAGSDRLIGGAGQDSFRFDTKLGQSNIDRISDFSVGSDEFILSLDIFSKISQDPISGQHTIQADEFHLGATAHDASDRILYDPATGKVSYDADGAGGSQAIVFAMIGKNLKLTYESFSIAGPII